VGLQRSLMCLVRGARDVKLVLEASSSNGSCILGPWRIEQGSCGGQRDARVGHGRGDCLRTVKVMVDMPSLAPPFWLVLRWVVLEPRSFRLSFGSNSSCTE
jgi:hypothetical protein